MAIVGHMMSGFFSSSASLLTIRTEARSSLETIQVLQNQQLSSCLDDSKTSLFESVHFEHSRLELQSRSAISVFSSKVCAGAKNTSG